MNRRKKLVFCSIFKPIFWTNLVLKSLYIISSHPTPGVLFSFDLFEKWGQNNKGDGWLSIYRTIFPPSFTLAFKPRGFSWLARLHCTNSVKWRVLEWKFTLLVKPGFVQLCNIVSGYFNNETVKTELGIPRW